MNSPLLLFIISSISFAILILLFKNSILEFGVFFCSSIFFGIAMACSFYAGMESFSISGGGLPEMHVGSVIALPVGQLFLAAAVLVTLGGLAGRLFLDVLGLGKKSTVRTEFTSKSIAISSKRGFKSFGLLFYVIYFSQTLPDLISREVYLFIEPGSVIGTMRYISPLIGFLSIGFMRYKYSPLLILLFFFSFFNESALNSRNAPSLMAGFVILGFVRINRRFTKFAFLFMGGVSSYIYFLYIMFSRTNQNYGFLSLVSQFSPFIENLPSQSIASSASTVLGNFLSVIPVTYLGMQIPTPDNYLSISFNPLFGKDVGWYDIGYLFYVNPWTPSGSVAQVAGLSSVFIFLTWLLVGFLFQLNGNLMYRVSNNSYLRILSFALPVFATLQFLQYTLRSGMRYVYLWLVIGVIANCVKRFNSPMQERNMSP
jgi:hypothetical protein